MKNNFNFLIATCLTILTISCQKEKEMIVQEKPSDIHTLSVAFPEMTDQNGTKVSLATDGTTGWAVGDKIVIYGNPNSSDATKRVVHEIVAGDIADPKVAVFSVDLSGLDAQFDKDGEDKYYDYTVAYPYTDGQPYYSGTGENNYGRSRFQNTNQLLMAGHVSDDNSSIVLNHLTAAITFSVNGDFDSYTFSGADGTEVVGYSSLVVEMNRRSLGEGKYRQKYNDGGTTGPLTSIQGSVNGNGTAVNHIFLPVNAERSGSTPYTYDLASQRYADVVYLPNGFTIKFFKGGVLKKYITSSAPLIIKPGHMINLGLLPAGSMHDAPTPHNNTIDVNVATAYDLSSSETANCYLLDSNTEIAANKAYKFKAAKGKGGGVLTNIGGDEDKDVVVLWETINTDTAPSVGSIISAVDYDLQDGGDAYIVFKMPSSITPGNAVIAAKNSAGVILWSWHIWVPASDVTSSQYGLGGQTWMDRNLGALTVAVASDESDVAASSLGLFYAWGRKDPFPGPTSAGTEENPIATTGTFNYTGGVMAKAADSYASPMTFVATGSDSNQYWAEDNASALWSTSKTKNDPCPPGYVVPQFISGEGVWKGATATGFAYNSDHKWVKMGSGSFIVFPILGFLDGCQPTAYIRYSNRTYIWSSTWKNKNTAYPLRLNAGGSSNTSEERQARGFSVRCVAE